MQPGLPNWMHQRSQWCWPQSSKPSQAALPCILHVAADCGGLAGPSWKVRDAALTVLQGVVFCNPFLLDTAQRMSVLDMAISSLRDKTLENRQKGSKTLCGLLRCVLDPAETELEAFQKKFEKESTKPVGKVSRHAGVLGLVSMLQLHPYRLAVWGPRVSSAMFVICSLLSMVHARRYWQWLQIT